MASITRKKTIFFVTSPRSPLKMVDEIRFLTGNFSGRLWNSETQAAYYEALSGQDFFSGGESSDPAFSARDRINRGPKSLGLVSLNPVVSLTPAGHAFINGNRSDEALLRQILKFQFPSPYHVDKEATFAVKPYLELMRFVRDLGGLSKTEIALFVIQLINHRDYPRIRAKIEAFRIAARENRERHQTNYRDFIAQQFETEITSLFQERISAGDIATRESDEETLQKFIKTKQRNHIDYADAAIRYLRATNLFTFNARSLRVSVMPERVADVDYILDTIERDPEAFASESEYGAYLFQSGTPALLTDNADDLTKSILSQTTEQTAENLAGKGVEELKDIFNETLKAKLNQIISQQRDELRTYNEYEDIQEMFDRIRTADIADPSLYLEWNTWRAFEMLDDGVIEGKFRVDNNGAPLYTAPGNTPDIVCKYTDFETIIEVTLSSGQRQYEMEGEPVSRHYGNHRRTTDKPVYAIFIAPQINPATLAHYFVLSRTEIQYYGGRSMIVPLSLNDFRRLLERARAAGRQPNSQDLHLLLNELSELATTAANEDEWYQQISSRIDTAFTVTT